MDEFMGERISYWIELQKRVESLNYRHLIREIAELSGKVQAYERRIKEMADIMKSN